MGEGGRGSEGAKGVVPKGMVVEVWMLGNVEGRGVGVGGGDGGGGGGEGETLTARNAMKNKREGLEMEDRAWRCRKKRLMLLEKRREGKEKKRSKSRLRIWGVEREKAHPQRKARRPERRRGQMVENRG